MNIAEIQFFYPNRPARVIAVAARLSISISPDAAVSVLAQHTPAMVREIPDVVSSARNILNHSVTVESLVGFRTYHPSMR